jgi:hypothetical protein
MNTECGLKEECLDSIKFNQRGQKRKKEGASLAFGLPRSSVLLAYLTCTREGDHTGPEE